MRPLCDTNPPGQGLQRAAGPPPLPSDPGLNPVGPIQSRWVPAPWDTTRCAFSVKTSREPGESRGQSWAEPTQPAGTLKAVGPSRAPDSSSSHWLCDPGQVTYLTGQCPFTIKPQWLTHHTRHVGTGREKQARSVLWGAHPLAGIWVLMETGVATMRSPRSFPIEWTPLA